METGSTILTQEQNYRARNAIIMHLQRRRRLEAYHRLEKLWEDFSGMLRCAYWLISFVSVSYTF
jgi:hypothetical protein